MLNGKKKSSALEAAMNIENLVNNSESRKSKVFITVMSKKTTKNMIRFTSN